MVVLLEGHMFAEASFLLNVCNLISFVFTFSLFLFFCLFSGCKVVRGRNCGEHLFELMSEYGSSVARVDLRTQESRRENATVYLDSGQFGPYV